MCRNLSPSSRFACLLLRSPHASVVATTHSYLVATCAKTEPAGNLERPLAHPRDGVEDDDPRDVEEEVSESDLEGVDGTRDKGRKKARDRRSDVGAEGDGEHDLECDDVETSERREYGRRNGRRLDEDSHSGSDEDGNVAVQVSSLRNKSDVQRSVDFE